MEQELKLKNAQMVENLDVMTQMVRKQRTQNMQEVVAAACNNIQQNFNQIIETESSKHLKEGLKYLSKTYKEKPIWKERKTVQTMIIEVKPREQDPERVATEKGTLHEHVGKTIDWMQIYLSVMLIVIEAMTKLRIDHPALADELQRMPIVESSITQIAWVVTYELMTINMNWHKSVNCSGEWALSPILYNMLRGKQTKQVSQPRSTNADGYAAVYVISMHKVFGCMRSHERRSSMSIGDSIQEISDWYYTTMSAMTNVGAKTMIELSSKYMELKKEYTVDVNDAEHGTELMLPIVYRMDKNSVKELVDKLTSTKLIDLLGAMAQARGEKGSTGMEYLLQDTKLDRLVKALKMRGRCEHECKISSPRVVNQTKREGETMSKEPNARQESLQPTRQADTTIRAESAATKESDVPKIIRELTMDRPRPQTKVKNDASDPQITCMDFSIQRRCRKSLIDNMAKHEARFECDIISVYKRVLTCCNSGVYSFMKMREEGQKRVLSGRSAFGEFEGALCRTSIVGKRMTESMMNRILYADEYDERTNERTLIDKIVALVDDKAGEVKDGEPNPESSEFIRIMLLKSVYEEVENAMDFVTIINGIFAVCIYALVYTVHIEQEAWMDNIAWFIFNNTTSGRKGRMQWKKRIPKNDADYIATLEKEGISAYELNGYLEKHMGILGVSRGSNLMGKIDKTMFKWSLAVLSDRLRTDRSVGALKWIRAITTLMVDANEAIEAVYERHGKIPLVEAICISMMEAFPNSRADIIQNKRNLTLTVLKEAIEEIRTGLLIMANTITVYMHKIP
jgi:hypothetical protein